MFSGVIIDMILNFAKYILKSFIYIVKTVFLDGIICFKSYVNKHFCDFYKVSVKYRF